MPSTRGLAEYYKRYSFSFPSTKRLMVLNAGLALLQAIATVLLCTEVFYYLIIFWALNWFSMAFLYKISPILFSPRRLAGFLFTTSLYTSILLVISIPLRKPLLAVLLGLQFSAVLTCLVTIFLTSQRTSLRLCLILINTTLVVLISVLYNTTLPLYYVLSLPIITTTLLFIKKVGSRTVGVNGLDLFRGYVNAFLADNPRPLERIFERRGITVEKRISIVLFKNDKKPLGCFIIPEVHPGPFRRVGGSSLPYILSSELRKGYGLITMVFHGPSTHAENPVSLSECLKISRQVSDLINECCLEKPEKVCSPVRRESSVIECFAIKFGKGKGLFFIDSFSEGLEDLSGEFTEILQKRKLEVILVDSHSSYISSDLNRPLTPETRLGKLVLKCLEDLANLECTGVEEIRAGFSEVLMEDYDARDGIGPGGLKACFLEILGSRYFILLFDANNMLLKVKKSLYDNIISKGNYRDGCIATTDTHVVAGLRGGEEYVPLGSRIPLEYLLNKSLEALEKAERSAKSCTVRVLSKKIRVKVMGRESIETLHRFVEKGLKAGLCMLFYIWASPLIFLAFL